MRCVEKVLQAYANGDHISDEEVTMVKEAFSKLFDALIPFGDFVAPTAYWAGNNLALFRSYEMARIKKRGKKESV